MAPVQSSVSCSCRAYAKKKNIFLLPGSLPCYVAHRLCGLSRWPCRRVPTQPTDFTMRWCHRLFLFLSHGKFSQKSNLHGSKIHKRKNHNLLYIIYSEKIILGLGELFVLQYREWPLGTIGSEAPLHHPTWFLIKSVSCILFHICSWQSIINQKS